MNQTVKEENLMKKIIFVILAFFLLGTLGCDQIDTNAPKIPQEPKKNYSCEFEELEIRQYETIVETGITANDVLALYDELAMKFALAKYGHDPWQDDFDPYLDSIKINFKSISTASFHNKDKTTSYYEYYAPSVFAYLSHNWLTDPRGEYYINASHKEIHNVYCITFNAEMSIEDEFFYDFEIQHMYVGISAFENVLKSFKVPSFEMTSDFASTCKIPLHASNHCGEMVYEPFVFDREVVKKADTNQLWAMYNFVKPICDVNFNAIDPDQS